MSMPWDRHPDDERPRTEAEEREYREGSVRIFVRRDDFNGMYDRQCQWYAMTVPDYDLGVAVGRGATPLEAVGDLLWHLDLDEDVPYCMEVR